MMPIGVPIPLDVVDMINARAAERGLSVAWILREAIFESMNRWK
jgi:hypothetical protein